jgi:peptidoglycan hydrolase-like protein with peptidoglycan-binding domain
MFYALSFLSLFLLLITDSPSSAAVEKLSEKDVRDIQSALKSLGLDPGPIDGILGPKTKRAITEFQKKQELRVTGLPDEKTVQALNDMEELQDPGPPSSPTNLRVVEIGP